MPIFILVYKKIYEEALYSQFFCAFWAKVSFMCASLLAQNCLSNIEFVATVFVRTVHWSFIYGY